MLASQHFCKMLTNIFIDYLFFYHPTIYGSNITVGSDVDADFYNLAAIVFVWY